jgi:NADH-quinone oxidoreductase chain G
MMRVTINGREITVPQGITVLEAARREGIAIPSFCAHELLEPYGACRMCLVEVEGMAKLQTACTLHPADGMTVITESDAIIEARRQVLEFLLINHPLDCPFCDKAGECDLQELVLRYGPTVGRYREDKRTVPASHTDHIFVRNMERCISCARCVRICAEVQGASALTTVGRGGFSRVEPFSDDSFDCEYCGNCLSACPVGAILSTLQMHSYRPWQIDRETETVCGECGVGCTLVVQARDQTIARVVPRPGLGINRGLLCSRGRFGYQYVNSGERLSTPLIRRGDSLEECSWEEALSAVADRLTAIKEAHGGSAIAGIASPRCTNEENYLFQKFLRVTCGSNNVDSLSRLGFAAAQDFLEAVLETGVTANEISAINDCETILVVGGDPTTVAPILGLSVRQAARRGARVAVIGHAPGLERFTAVEVVPRIADEPAVLEAVLSKVAEHREVSAERIERAIARLKDLTPPAGTTQAVAELSDLLLGSAPTAIVLGPELVQRSDGHRALLALAGLVHALDARLYLLAEGPNEQGLIDVGCVPNRLPGGVPIRDAATRGRFEEEWNGPIPSEPGLSLMEMVEAAGSEIRALYVMGENPVFKVPKSSFVREALSSLELLVVQDIFLTETARLADVVLPALAWSERSGSYTNLERRVQRLGRAIEPRVGRSDWRIVCDLSTAMGSPMAYAGPDEIMIELARVSPLHDGLDDRAEDGAGWLVRRSPWPRDSSVETRPPAPTSPIVSEDQINLAIDRILFHGGTTSRNAPALRQICPEAVARVGHDLARSLGLEDGERVRLSTSQGSVTVPIRIDPSVRDHRVLLSNHFEDRGVLGLLDYALDPVTKAPGIESCEVRIEKVAGDCP